MNRARRSLLMGKYLGVVYSCSDDIALSQIVAQIKLMRAGLFREGEKKRSSRGLNN